MRLFDGISQMQKLRRVALPLLRAFAFDFEIRHPWVDGARVRLNSFLHKGYWFFGKERERHTMEFFAQIISPGMRVVEVGGHIGFITAYFAKLVGRGGNVVVFEPGSNNLTYTRYNISLLASLPRVGHVDLVELAVGSETGSASFFEDNLTGQNNSLVKDFKGLDGNAQLAHTEVQVQERVVQITTLDDHLADQDVDFIKIDVEGFEYGVLLGMQTILKTNLPALMVEVQADEEEIWIYFNNASYVLFDEQGNLITRPELLVGNVFCLEKNKHSHLIKNLLKEAKASA